ncbi:MAG: iron-sulfur cluster carrier protein [Cyclobacteriaceae bacterium]|nr:MAG: iron-sulfur cluster carrier protein [Cyclobacteriaceae bacterium]
MGITRESVLDALRTVEDPDLKQDLVSLNMIQDLKVSEGNINFTVVLTTPACPLKEVIKNACLEAINQLVSSNVKTTINMTSNVTSIRGKDAPLLPEVKNIIAVSSGKGGVGKSTVSVNLAVSLAKAGAKVGLIDADIFGPSIPTMFNCTNEQPGIIKKGDKNLIVPIEQYGVKLLSIGFLTPADNAVIWRGPMASSALKQFIGDTEWGSLDYLIVDLPPGTSDIHLTLVQSVPVTGAIIVTTPQKVALADASKGLAMFKQPNINVPVLGIVENMAYFIPPDYPDNKYFIFGEDGGKKFAEQHQIPLLAQIPLEEPVRISGDNGYPVAMEDGSAGTAFRALAENLAREIAIRNAQIPQTKKVEMNT